MLTLLLKLGPMLATPNEPAESTLTAKKTETTEPSSAGETTVTEAVAEEAHDPDEHAAPNAPVEAPNLENDDADHDHAGHTHTETSGLYETVDFATEAPVFYRPTVGDSGSRAVASRTVNPARTSDGKVCRNVNAAPPGAKIVFPLTREHFDTYEDTWGAARPQGGHEGTDLMVENGTPLLAMTDATVVPVSGANGNGWNTLGGYTVMLQADYSIGPVKKGDIFYYAHMNRPTNLDIGDRVRVGDVVGYVGDTGQGPEGTTGQFPSHLHLGWYDASGARSEVASGAMNPYPLLEWVRANGGSIKGGSNIPYCEAPQSSAPTPSGGGSWQLPTNPGIRPDIDTGTNSASPSPVLNTAPSAETDDAGRDRPARAGNGNNQANAGENPQAVPARPGKDQADAGRIPDARPGKNASKPDGAATSESSPVVSGDAATAEPTPNPPSSGSSGTSGSAAGGSAGGNATANTDADTAGRPFKGFWKLDREGKIRFLLRLDRTGVDISRFEKWLDKALGKNDSVENIPAEPQPNQPETTTPEESPPETTDPEKTCDKTGEAPTTRPDCAEDPAAETPNNETPQNEAGDTDENATGETEEGSGIDLVPTPGTPDSETPQTEETLDDTGMEPESDIGQAIGEAQSAESGETLSPDATSGN